jgi:alpha-tubulin suppressor-like RCC1 family protein
MQVFSALKRAFAAKESKEKKPENSPKSNFGFLIQQPSLYRAQLANWGRSTEGNLGRDTRRTNTELPEYVTIEARVLNVSARGWHTVVVTDIGCFGFGWNEVCKKLFYSRL